jgi:hypothetical protein
LTNSTLNKNILTRINRELGGDFDLDAFDHLALWNAAHSRKFNVDMFTRPAAEAGWSANKVWISDAPRVALFHLEPALGENL